MEAPSHTSPFSILLWFPFCREQFVVARSEIVAFSLSNRSCLADVAQMFVGTDAWGLSDVASYSCLVESFYAYLMAASGHLTF